MHGDLGRCRRPAGSGATSRGRQGDGSVLPHFQAVQVRAIVATAEPVTALTAVIEETEARCP